MNASGKFAIVGSSVHSARFRAHMRVEKINASNAPHGERRDKDVRTIALAPLQTNARLSQIETASCDPNWNGPRLTAPFVAQVLGQVLTQDGEDRRSALSAYRGEAQVFSALLCDRRA